MPELHTHLLFILILSYISILPELPPSGKSIHELLRCQGLPGGLFPKNTKSYTLDIANMVLEVHMEKPCITEFETTVFFDSVVRANLRYGGLFGIQGLSDKRLFLWFPVKDIVVFDPSSGLLSIDVSLANETVRLSQFHQPRFCKPHVVRPKDVVDVASNFRKTFSL